MNEHTENESGTVEETPAVRGERLGASLEAAVQQEAAAAATPEGRQADRKSHRTVVIAAVAFAVLLIGAGVAYSVLAPTAEREVQATGTATAHRTPRPSRWPAKIARRRRTPATATEPTPTQRRHPTSP